MSQDNAIVPAEVAALVNKNQDDAAFKQVAKTGDYLPRLQVCGSNTKLVKKNKVPQGVYALVWDDENFKNLGDNVEALIIAWRTKAMRIDGDVVESYYDHTSPEFQKIQADSDVEDSGCMAGPEYLLWLPAQKEFCGFHMSSKSARRVSGKMYSIFKENTPDKRIARLTITLAEKGKYSWHAPVVNISTAPLTAVPDWKDPAVLKILNEFVNPSSSKAEKAPEAAGNERAR